MELIQSDLAKLGIGLVIAVVSAALGFWFKGHEIRVGRKVDFYISEAEAIVRPNFSEIRLEVDGGTYDSVYAYYFWIANSGREVVENVRVDIDCPDGEVIFIKEFNSSTKGAKLSGRGVFSEEKILSFEYDYINPQGMHRMTFLTSSDNNFRVTVEGKGLRVNDFRERQKKAIKTLDIMLKVVPGFQASDLVSFMRHKG